MMVILCSLTKRLHRRLQLYLYFLALNSKFYLCVDSFHYRSHLEIERVSETSLLFVLTPFIIAVIWKLKE